MRAYFFTNMYLSDIQRGIQTAHVMHEMFTYYDRSSSPLLYDWADNHKTIIVLNAGYSSTLEEIQTHLANDENYLPWNFFRESEEALNNALTCIGIIVPEAYYNTTVVGGEEVPAQHFCGSWNWWDAQTVSYMRKFNLA